MTVTSRTCAHWPPSRLGLVLGLVASQAACNDCKVSSDCPPDQRCIVGECRGLRERSGCGTNAECPSGQTCQGGFCRGPRFDFGPPVNGGGGGGGNLNPDMGTSNPADMGSGDPDMGTSNPADMGSGDPDMGMSNPPDMGSGDPPPPDLPFLLRPVLQGMAGVAPGQVPFWVVCPFDTRLPILGVPQGDPDDIVSYAGEVYYSSGGNAGAYRAVNDAVSYQLDATGAIQGYSSIPPDPRANDEEVARCPPGTVPVHLYVSGDPSAPDILVDCDNAVEAQRTDPQTLVAPGSTQFIQSPCRRQGGPTGVLLARSPQGALCGDSAGTGRYRPSYLVDAGGNDILLETFPNNDMPAGPISNARPRPSGGFWYLAQTQAILQGAYVVRIELDGNIVRENDLGPAGDGLVFAENDPKAIVDGIHHQVGLDTSRGGMAPPRVLLRFDPSSQVLRTDQPGGFGGCQGTGLDVVRPL